MNVKSGLWETTSVTERSGMPSIPPEQLAKMPPDIRAKMQGMSGPSTSTSQSCMTKEDVSKFHYNQDKSCKVTVVSTSTSKEEFKFECTGQQASTGSMKMEAPDSTHVNGLILINMTANGRPMNMKVTTSAKWLGEDCGSVKPASDKKE